MRLLLAALLALAASPASAVMGHKHAREDARRFGLSKGPAPTISEDTARKAIEAFNAKPSGGLGAAAFLGGGSGHRRPRAAADAFLADSKDVLGVSPLDVEVLREQSGAGHHHVLYRQKYKGVPVEFSRVKVHLDDAGKVTGAHSTFRPRLDLDVRPTVAASIAAYTVKRDAGQDPRSDAQLVVFPGLDGADARLAWKFVVDAGGKWIYYVDAHSGELIYRYDDRRYLTCAVGQTSGTIRGLVYALDQQHGSPTLQPLAHERVFIASTGTWVDTDGNGDFCAGNASPLVHSVGKIFTALQGPFINVANFRGPSAHYDNSKGVWATVGTPISSPHPYPDNAVLISTIDISGLAGTQNAVKFLPIFNNFNVGQVTAGALGEAADISDNDQVAVIDSSGNITGSYVGARGNFNGAAVVGKRLRLRLHSNSSGGGNGYDVVSSSYLVLSNPTSVGPAMVGAANTASGSFDWLPSSYNVMGLRGEIAAFYNLNKMHDYFVGDVDRSSAIAITPTFAMAYVGPNLLNAFYDPENDGLFFGDTSDASPSDLFTDDATVAHHEYSHFVVEKIWPIQNFGQAGAISEALADYFAASSLNYSAIGRAIVEGLGGSGPLRELDCATNPPCKKLTDTIASAGDTQWSGEIHDDSIFVSQALWDLRRSRITAQGSTARGASCADNLVFQALMFFPESFTELQAAIQRVDAVGAAPMCQLGTACGTAANCVGAATIQGFFANHGISSVASTSDPYDTIARHNDGFETAVDISTIAQVSGTIYPAGDLDFYSFAAAPGWVELELSLPADGSFFKGYALTVYDKDHKVLAQGDPPYDGTDTDSGLCVPINCTTTSSKVKLKFYNPSAQLLFVQVAGGATLSGGSSSGVNSATGLYSLKTAYTRSASLSASIVSALLDNDVISFTVNVATFGPSQEYFFAYAQLRDHAQLSLPGTRTDQGGPYLTFVSSANAGGVVSGRARIAGGFDARFPSVGSVAIEVFAYNVLGSTVSLGLSAPLSLTTAKAEVKAWNNVFNPARGEKTTIRYDVQEPGRLTMRLYTLSGGFIATLFDDTVQPGKGAVDWTGRNLSGTVVASGIYLLHIQGPGISKTQKVAIVK